MLDPKLLRTELDSVATKLKRRGFILDTALFNELETKRKKVQVDTQELQNERNTKSKSIGKAKAQGEDIQPLLDEVASLGNKLQASEDSLKQIQQQVEELVLGIPNTPDDSVPDGLSEDDNVVERSWGDRPKFDF